MAKTFKELAAPLAKLGIRVVPDRGKIPVFEGWQNLASVDLAKIDEWSAGFPQATGVGVVSPESCGYWVLDADDWSWLVEEMNARKVKPFKSCRVMTGSGRGVHFYFKGERKPWMKGVKNPRFVSDAETPNEKKMLLEFPLHVVGPGSIHPKTGRPYQPAIPVEQWELSECPDEMLAFLHEMCSITKRGVRAGIEAHRPAQGADSGAGARRHGA